MIQTSLTDAVQMMTPLLFAVSCGYMEMVRLLVDLGADRDCSDKNVSYDLVYCLLSCSHL